jgi:pimeloyl-ACP methyl ester carboxylesterase
MRKRILTAISVIIGLLVLGIGGVAASAVLPNCGIDSIISGAGQADPPAAGISGVRDGRLALRDGGEIHYREAGQGTPIVLIHGTGGDSGAWFGSFARLAETHRVIAYDRRGFGSSTALKAGRYLDAQAEDAAELIRERGLAPATVVGHSWGGVVALALTIKHPELVSTLVLMEPPYRAKEHATPDFLLTIIRVKLQAQFKGDQCAAATFFRFATHRTDGVTSFDQLPIQAQQAGLRSAAGSMAELDAGTGEEMADDQVAQIKVPVLLMEGGVSQALFRSLAERLATLLPQARVQVIQGAGHLMQFDQPAEVERGVLGIAR